ANTFVHHALVDYVVRVIAATRKPADFGMQDVAGWIAYGASPRASLGIIAAARAVALIRGRDYVVPQDVVEVIPDVLRHRLVLSYDALADEISPEDVIKRVLQTVGMPQVAPQAVAPGSGAPQQVSQPSGPQGAAPQPQQQPVPQAAPQPPNGQQSQPAGNVQNK
ncbi:AAA family ATPase, partial [Nocardia tenerifensis]